MTLLKDETAGEILLMGTLTSGAERVVIISDCKVLEFKP